MVSLNLHGSLGTCYYHESQFTDENAEAGEVEALLLGFAFGQSDPRAPLLAAPPRPECDKYKNPTVFLFSPSFFTPLLCGFIYEHHPGSARLAGRGAGNMVVLQEKEG